MEQAFCYYSQMAPTGYSVTVRLDVTRTRAALRDRGLKFFPAYVYLATRAVGTRPELRVALQDGVLGRWEQLTPAYPCLHRENGTTSLLWSAYHPDFAAFYCGMEADRAQYGADPGLLTRKGPPPPNAYVVSCIPWFSFESFSLHNHGLRDYYVPSLEAGGFDEGPDGVRMPLSVTAHHATTEGWRLKLFFEELQRLLDTPSDWLGEAT